LNAVSEQHNQHEFAFWIKDSQGTKLAFVLRAGYKAEGLQFFTEDSATFQLGAMTRPSGEYIEAHVHENVQRNISGTNEVLFLQSGKIRVDIFNEINVYQESFMMHQGDAVLLCEGGHGIEIIEEARLLEVKQGPFIEGGDKTKFDHNLPSELKFRGQDK
jgi:hypothetical protein